MVRSTRSCPGTDVVAMQRNYPGRRVVTADRQPRAGQRSAPAGRSAWSRSGPRTGLSPRLLALAAAAGAAAALLPAIAVRAASLFDAQPVDSGRFAVLARPIGREDWTLLVLEQLKPAPLCWQTRADGLVDPSLNRFDYTGICGRYLDSNGYSLRLAGAEGGGDGTAGLRLHIEPVGSELQLQASSADLAGVIVVGRAPLPGRQREAFVPIRLEPGWELQRRSYGAQVLNHLYFSNRGSARELLAQAGSSPSGPSSPRLPVAAGRRFALLAPPPPPPPLSAEIAPARRGPQPRTLSQARFSTQPPAGSPSWDSASGSQAGLRSGGPISAATASRVIALQVIPFQE